MNDYYNADCREEHSMVMVWSMTSLFRRWAGKAFLNKGYLSPGKGSCRQSEAWDAAGRP